jgi:hypothetical protein
MQKSSSKSIGIVIVLIIIIVGVWLMTRGSDDSKNYQPVAPTTADTNPQPTTPATPEQKISSSGTSDAALNQDTAAIDTQLGGLKADSTTAAQ